MMDIFGQDWHRRLLREGHVRLAGSENKQNAREEQNAQDNSSKHRFIDPAKCQDAERRPG
jgi:hypothetical protein